MHMITNRILKSLAGAALAITLIAGAQTPPPPAPAPAPANAPAVTPAPATDQAPAAPAAPATPTWSVGPMDISGLIDGYYSFNVNQPTAANNGQVNDLYNFNDKTDQFNQHQFRRPAELRGAGFSQPQAAQGEGLRTRLWQVCHLSRRGSD